MCVLKFLAAALGVAVGMFLINKAHEACLRRRRARERAATERPTEF